MQIKVTYVPNTRRYGNCLKIEHEWKLVDGHLKAVEKRVRVLIDLTDIPF